MYMHVDTKSRKTTGIHVAVAGTRDTIFCSLFSCFTIMCIEQRESMKKAIVVM